MHIDELFQTETEKVKAALATGDRQQFLATWFSSEAARVLGQDPSLRGHFAREAGLTSEELREWGSAGRVERWR